MPRETEIAMTEQAARSVRRKAFAMAKRSRCFAGAHQAAHRRAQFGHQYRAENNAVLVRSWR